MSPIFKWDSNIRGKRRIFEKARVWKKNIYICRMLHSEYIGFPLLRETSVSTEDGRPLRSGDKLFSLIKNCKSVRICVWVYMHKSKRRESRSRTCKDNFHELGLTISLRFPRIMIIPRFRTAPTFRQIFDRVISKPSKTSNLPSINSANLLVSPSLVLFAYVFLRKAFVKKFISPSLWISSQISILPSFIKPWCVLNLHRREQRERERETLN